MAESCSPNIKNRSHSITAHVEVPAEGGDGVLVAAGGVVGGYALYVKDRKPVYEYNYFTAGPLQGNRRVAPSGRPLRRSAWSSSTTAGDSGRAERSSCFVNGKEVGTGRVEKTEPARFSADETFDIGCDTGSPVSSDYKSPFRFGGKIKKVEIKLEEDKLTPGEQAEIKKMHAAAEAARH